MYSRPKKSHGGKYLGDDTKMVKKIVKGCKKDAKEYVYERLIKHCEKN